MPESTAKPAKPARLTWHDWMPPGSPPPEEMSRVEFIDRLTAMYVDVRESDVRYWERTDVIPRPAKRWHDGTNHVYYPRFALFMIALLRALQGLDAPLRSITPRLKDAVPMALAAVRHAEKHEAEARQKAERFNSQFEDFANPFASDQPADYMLKRYADAAAKEALREVLKGEVAAIAKRYAAVTGRTVDHVNITFHHLQGGELEQFDMLPVPIDRI
jgi:DNA-binding transcriptional MerR regulator